jgi:hypothetical protein
LISAGVVTRVEEDPMADPEAEHGKREFDIFVGDIEEKWDRKEAPVDEIMRRAGVTEVKGHILEALDGKNGTPVKEFKPGETVDLSVPDRKFFRITPGGGGFS